MVENISFDPQKRKEAEFVAQYIVQNIIERCIFHLTTNEMEFLTNRRSLEDKKQLINSFNFRFMSYNILADSLSDLTTNNFKEFDLKYLDWRYRAKIIQREIAFHSPDIICLQEIEMNDSLLLPSLESEYGVKVKLKTGGRVDGLATLYRKDKFKLIESKYIEFKDTHPLIAKEHVALFVVLGIKSPIKEMTNELLIIANLHTLFNEKRGDIKVVQIYLTMKALEELSLKYKQYDKMVFLAADLNVIPNSAIYSWIYKSEFNFSEIRNNLMSGQRQGAWSKGKNFKDLKDFVTFLTNHYEYNKSNAEVKLTSVMQWIQILRDAQLTLDDNDQKIKIIEAKAVSNNEPNGEDPSKFDFLIKTPLQMRSAYSWFRQYLFENYNQSTSQALLKKDSTFECLMTHCAINGPLTVDYIWFTEIPANLESYKRLRVIRVVETPQIEDLEQISRKFPQKFFPSDHFSLVVDFAFDV